MSEDPDCRFGAIKSCILEGLGVSTRFESYAVSEAESERMITAALDGVRGKNFIGVSSAATSSAGATA